jgi:hypothetical protein
VALGAFWQGSSGRHYHSMVRLNISGRSPGARSEDADFDDRGLIYLADRNVGFDILKLHENCDWRSFLGHSGFAQTGEISGFK